MWKTSLSLKIGVLTVPLTPIFLFSFPKRIHNLVKIKVPLTPKFYFLFSKVIHNLVKIRKRIELIHQILAKLRMFEVLMTDAYFSNFKNSQKIEGKSYDYNFFTNVIRTKRTFLAAKKELGVRGALKKELSKSIKSS